VSGVPPPIISIKSESFFICHFVSILMAFLTDKRKRSTRTHTQELANTFFSDRTQAGKKVLLRREGWVSSITRY
jgi:hypothetical protein